MIIIIIISSSSITDDSKCYGEKQSNAGELGLLVAAVYYWVVREGLCLPEKMACAVSAK